MRYVSLLRGINVSGQKKILMRDLKSLYEKLGFEEVVTYIQTGNVIFSSAINTKPKLIEKIEVAIQQKYKFHVPVLLRTSLEIEIVIENCPYSPVNIEQDGTKILVSFLSSKPSTANINKVLEYVKDGEKLIVRGKEAYLYCPIGYGKSKLTNSFVENKLGIGSTTRNWKSVNKLYELSLI